MLQFRKFILFGDSITQYSNAQNGFALAPALQDLYSRKMDIVTRGYSGYNTDQGVVVLREVLKADHAENGNIKLMYLFMGTNDAATTFQAVPVDRYKANLQKMVDLARGYNIKVSVVGPALHYQKGLVNDALTEPFLSNKATRQYSAAAAEVARANSVPFVDLWSKFQQYGGWSTEELLADTPDTSELVPDGVHFSPKAYKLFYEALVETIAQNYPELEAEKLEQVFPYYRDIDYADNEGSLMKYIE